MSLSFFLPTSRRLRPLFASALLLLAGCAGSSSNNSGTSTPTPAIQPPVLGSITPTSATIGTGSVALTATGSNFTNSSQILVAGVNIVTTYVNPTTVTGTITASQLATAGSIPVAVQDGSLISAAQIFTVQPPAPTITLLSPASIIAGSPATLITIAGTNFSSTCVAQINGTPVSTAYSLTTRLYATVPAALLTASGSLAVKVACVNVTSNTATLQVIDPPAPTLTYVSPQAVPVNTATTLLVSGTNFSGGSVVQINGTAVPTLYNSSTSLSASIPAGLLTLSGTYSVQVFTASPGGGTSATLALQPYVALTNNSMVYNPGNGLFYLSVPGSVGAPYGNSIVTVDPVTGAIGNPIFVGSDPDRLALSADNSVLWVGLDGSASVAKVLLASNTVSYTFTTGGNSGVYATPVAPVALAALPGSNDSVVTAGYSSGSFNNPVQIFDHGVARAGSFSTYISYPTALQVDGTRNEIYGASNGGYYVFPYTATGITTKTTASGTYASYGNDDLQALGGKLYTDVGKVYDTESGSLLGSIYSSGTTLATGPTVADSALGKIFVLDAGSTSGTQSQIQIFDSATYLTSSAVIPVPSITTGTSGSTSPSRLTRWGANGLAFRTGAGLFSLRSNLINNLANTNADVSVTVSVPAATATGSASSFTVKVANSGPSAASSVALALNASTSSSITSVTSSQGVCSLTSCNLGSLSSGSTATVIVTVQQFVAGNGTLGATVLAAENDPVTSNNTASATTVVTGATYAPAPVVTAISPSAIQTGLPSATTITVTGSNFNSGSTILLSGTALTTTFVNSTKLTATVPTTTSASLGWAPLTVTTPAPGGGASAPLPLSFFQVLTAGLNHLVYDPFSRKIMASVGSGSSSLTGNSLVALTPETGTFGTPVAVGSQPSYLGLATDGSILYTILTGSQSVARFNMLTQSLDYTYTPPANSSFDGGTALRGVAVQPGQPNTIALDIASFTGLAIYDFNPASKTAAIRGQATGPYSGSSLHFLDATNLFGVDTDTSGATFNHYTVTSTGFQYYNYSQYTESTLNHFGTFTINGGLAFANNGGVANPSTTPATQIGYYPAPSTYAYGQLVAPDVALNRVFFLGTTTVNNFSYTPDGLISFDETTFLPTSIVPLNMAAIEGNTSYTAVELVRWGQDGLAALTSGGHVYLLRGAVVVPAELTSNPNATVVSLSATNATHGAGNTTLTVNGSNFVRGAAVLWNGSYRTTTYVSPTQLSVAIPASDLATAGSAAVTVSNPNASASGSLTFTIQ